MAYKEVAKPRLWRAHIENVFYNSTGLASSSYSHQEKTRAPSHQVKHGQSWWAERKEDFRVHLPTSFSPLSHRCGKVAKECLRTGIKSFHLFKMLNGSQVLCRLQWFSNYTSTVAVNQGKQEGGVFKIYSKSWVYVPEFGNVHMSARCTGVRRHRCHLWGWSDRQLWVIQHRCWLIFQLNKTLLLKYAISHHNCAMILMWCFMWF